MQTAVLAARLQIPADALQVDVLRWLAEQASFAIRAGWLAEQQVAFVLRNLRPTDGVLMAEIREAFAGAAKARPQQTYRS